jgi:hypothetical protein
MHFVLIRTFEQVKNKYDRHAECQIKMLIIQRDLVNEYNHIKQKHQILGNSKVIS